MIFSAIHRHELAIGMYIYMSPSFLSDQKLMAEKIPLRELASYQM